MISSFYQVGGSLSDRNSTYVTRPADEEVYTALTSGEFCYVFNSRQMGKSSLLVRTKSRLELAGYHCTIVDMTRIGSQQITPLQWYKGVVADLWRGFGCLGKINLKTWWESQSEISLVQRLSEFIEELLLQQFPEENLCIFIDEIDSILSLDFPIDDFFALIRYCYNQRAVNPAYNRITFALFGVATPSDLIRDKTRTPLNLGKAINLAGFSQQSALALAAGLSGKFAQPERIIQAILAWTEGQPFLTQKLCYLANLAAQESQSKKLQIPVNTEAFWVENLVREHLINNWESQDEPEHLKTIRDRLLRNEQRAGRLLGIYQRILQAESLENSSDSLTIDKIASDDSREQIELLLSGLVVKNKSFLRVKNRIYQEVFNLEWVEKQLANLRPYSQTFDAWITSQKEDKSRLLRGQALKDAQIWALGKSLSDLDYQFLAASQELDRSEVQQALEAARIKEFEARLEEEQKRLALEKKSAKRQKLLLGIVSFAFLLASGLGLTTFFQYRKALASEHQARISEIQALVSSSEGLFASNRRLDALIEAIKAKRRLQQLKKVDFQTENQVENVLQQAVYETDEFNRLSGHQAAVIGVAISPDSEFIASASVDKTIKLWRRDGKLVRTLTGHEGNVRAIAFSPDGKMLVSGSDDRTIKLWQLDGTLLKTLRSHTAAVWGVAWSPDGQAIASSGMDGKVNLWQTDGTLLKTLQDKGAGVWGITFSPDGELIAAASLDKTVKLWNRDGTFHQAFQGHDSLVTTVSFSPDGQILASGGGDKTVKLWTRNGTLLRTLPVNSSAIYGIAWSPDSQILAFAGIDKIIELWRFDGTKLDHLRGHTSAIWDVAWSPDGSYLASAGTENVVRLWQTQNPFRTVITAEKGGVWGVDISSDSNTILTGTIGGRAKLWNRQGKLLTEMPNHHLGSVSVAFSPDDRFFLAAAGENTVHLWQRDGTLMQSFVGHTAPVWTVAFRPDGQIIASGSEDTTIKLWRTDGKLLKTLTGHNSTVWQVAFSPDGQTIASASADGTVKLWKLDGSLIRTLSGHQTAVWRVAFDPEGKIIASGSGDNTVKLWQLDGKLLRTLSGHQAAVWGMAFSSNGQILASGSVDNTVKLWQLDGRELTTLRGHTAAIRQVAFSLDDKFVASVSEDNTLILWNVERVVNLDFWEYGCEIVEDYLRTNQSLEEGEVHLCDGVGN